VQAVVGLHQVGPLALVPAAVLGLLGDDRVEELPPQQAMEGLACSQFQALQRGVEAVGVELGVEFPPARPDEGVGIDLAMQQIAINSPRQPDLGLGTPEVIMLTLRVQEMTEVGRQGGAVWCEAPGHPVQVPAGRDMERDTQLIGRGRQTGQVRRLLGGDMAQVVELAQHRCAGDPPGGGLCGHGCEQPAAGGAGLDAVGAGDDETDVAGLGRKQAGETALGARRVREGIDQELGAARLLQSSPGEE